MLNTEHIIDTVYKLVGTPVYLCGSRYMVEREVKDGTKFMRVDKYTDYDLFCQYTPEILEIIKSNMLFEENVLYGSDIKDILSHSVFNIRISGYTVQLCLKYDAELFKKVMRVISVEFYSKHLWKSSSRRPSKESIREILNALYLTAGYVK